MKLARFSVAGIIYDGTVRADGVLVSAEGREFSSAAVTWLPPVVPSKAIGLALNFADHAE